VKLIVSDNSPLNLLVQLGHSDVLPQLFSSVIIPPDVVAEMNRPRSPQSVKQFLANPPAWLVVQAPQNLLTLPRLHAGEVAAISLAVELGATLMIDEAAGRAEAKRKGVPVTGAVGVLELAANNSVIADLATVHAAIRSLRFHVSEAILDASMAKHLAFKRSRAKP
jgi:predicted nucleic acid-binding protein